jgi:hypothetical protein
MGIGNTWASRDAFLDHYFEKTWITPADLNALGQLKRANSGLSGGVFMAFIIAHRQKWRLYER